MTELTSYHLRQFLTNLSFLAVEAQTSDLTNIIVQLKLTNTAKKVRNVRWVYCLFLAYLLSVSTSLWASCPPRDPGIDVAVGVRIAPPFINPDPILGNAGLAIDLWNSIEATLQAGGHIGSTQLIECSLADQLEALSNGQLDVVISPLTITDDRMQNFDFGVQYLSSGITLARKQANVINFQHAGQVLKDTVLQPGMPRAIFIFLLINLVASFFFAHLLKKHSSYADVINREPRGLVWFRAPLETLVRTVGLQGLSTEFRGTLATTFETILAIIGTLLSAAIFGVLASALISSIGHSNEISVNSLGNLRIATLNASTSQQFIEEKDRFANDIHSMRAPQTPHNPGFSSGRWSRLADRFQGRSTIELSSGSNTSSAVPASGCVNVNAATASSHCLTVDSWREAMQMLANDEVDGVVGDWAQLSFLARTGHYGRGIHIQTSVFQIEPYGWGVSRHRPELRAMIDRELMVRIRHPEWRGFVQSYLGEGSIGAN